MDEGLSWMLNPGRSPAVGGGSEELGKVGPQESHNSSRPELSGTDREVWVEPWLKSHQRGLMRARTSDPRLLPEREKERESEKEILWCRGSILTVYFSISFSLLLSPFIPTTGLPTRRQQQGPHDLGLEAKGDIWGTCRLEFRLQAGISIEIWVRMFSIPSVSRELFSSVMEDRAKIANRH